MRAINWLTLVIAIIAVVFGCVAFIQTNALKGNYESLTEDVTGLTAYVDDSFTYLTEAVNANSQSLTELTTYVDESLTHLTEAVNANSQSLIELTAAVNQEIAKLTTKEYVDQNIAQLATELATQFNQALRNTVDQVNQGFEEIRAYIDLRLG